MTTQTAAEAAPQWQCRCGAPFQPATWKALTPTLELVEIHSFSCPTSGCDGNLVERWSNRLNDLKDQLNCESETQK